MRAGRTGRGATRAGAPRRGRTASGGIPGRVAAVLAAATLAGPAALVLAPSSDAAATRPEQVTSATGVARGGAVATVAVAPLPPPPDPAALAALPDAPTAVPGARRSAPCPPGVAPSALDAFGGGGGDGGGDPVPGAGAGVLVAVVDTGVARHPRLAGRVTDGGDFVLGRSGLDDCDGHGTAVAGLLAAAPAPADLLEGAAPGVRVLAVRQSSAVVRTPAGPTGDLATLARAVRHAAAAPGVAVMTLSLAACTTPDAVAVPSPALGALRAAIRDATDRGVVVVAAAGNTGTGAGDAGATGGCGPQNTDDRVATVPVPAWFDDDVLTVGAVDDAGRPAPSSLAGPWVDVAARGDAPVSLDARGAGLTTALTPPGGGPTPLTGTSFAVPRVAAVAAELRRRLPDLSARDVAARIADTAVAPPGLRSGTRDPVVGRGVLDVAAALDGRPASERAAATRPPDDDAGPGTVTALAVGGGVGVALGVGATLLVRRRTRERP